jgi:hypothetical protein
MKDEGGDSACPPIPPPTLKSDNDVLPVRGLSHYEGRIIRREKTLPERSGFFISYEKWIFWIFREIVHLLLLG